LIELLGLVRGNDRRRASSDFREVKTLRILERLHEAILHEKVPSLEEMERARKSQQGGEGLKTTDRIEAGIEEAPPTP
jgi:hypothetical protein